MNDEGPPPVSPRLALSASILTTLLLLAALPFFIGFGYWRHGSAGLVSALASFGVAWVGAMATLVILSRMRGPQAVMNGVMIGMMVRMGWSAAAGWGLSQFSDLKQAGVFLMVVAYYLAALVVETVLAVKFAKNADSA